MDGSKLALRVIDGAARDGCNARMVETKPTTPPKTNWLAALVNFMANNK